MLLGNATTTLLVGKQDRFNRWYDANRGRGWQNWEHIPVEVLPESGDKTKSYLGPSRV
jgi:hypothetical protein